MKIVDDILRREGSTYTNRAADRGGPTKYGITLATLADWRGRPTTAEDVRALTEAEAREIYTARYVHPFAGIADDFVRELVTDTGVLHGVGRASRWLQEVANQMGAGLKVDGGVGPKTLAAVNALDAKDLAKRYLARRFAGFADFVQHNPDQLANLEGWNNRACEFLIKL